MSKNSICYRGIVVTTLICLIIAVTVLKKTDGPVASRIAQVMEGNVVTEIKAEAEAATASVQLKWDQFLLGGEHPQTLRRMESAISAYGRAGHGENAETLALNLLAAKEVQFGKDHWETLNTVHDLGFGRWVRQDYPSAEKYFRRALDGRLKMLGEAHWATANAAQMLSHTIDRQQTNPEEALAFAELALKGFRRDPNPDIPISVRNGQYQRLQDYIQELKEKVNVHSVGGPAR